MKYKEMTDPQKEKAFAEDVLGWRAERGIGGWLYEPTRIWMDKFEPLTDLNHAMLGVEKFAENDIVMSYSKYYKKNHHVLIETWSGDTLAFAEDDALNEAIVEACLRIKRPDLFDKE